MSSSIKYTTCPLCEANCGLEVHLKGNTIDKIIGDTKDPISKGYMCVKGKALKELHEDPDRLRQPIIRDGDNWREVSWEEALKFAANGINKLKSKYVSDSIALFQGNPLGHSADAIWYYWILSKSLRTKNIYSPASLDQLPHMLVAEQLYGNLGMFTIPDIDRTDYMLIIGANPIVSNGSIMTAPNVGKRLRDIQKRDGKIVVVDPRKTETAQLSDKFISIIPGTDVYFLSALINTLFNENLVKTDEIAPYVDGVESIQSMVNDYSPEKVEHVTGIKKEDLIELAHEFANAKSATIYPRIGASTQQHGTLTHWLCHIIAILTGNLDKPGAMMFTKPAIDFIGATHFLGESGQLGQSKSRVKGYKSFRGEFPSSTLLDEIQTPGHGQIKGLITVAGNPVLSSPNGKLLGNELKDLDFMVSIDIYKNETTRHANVILPPAFSLENPRFEAAFPIMSVRNKLKYSEPILATKNSSLSDGEILREISQRVKHKPLKFTLILLLLPFNTLVDFMLRIGYYGNKFNPFKNGINFSKLKRKEHGIDFGALESMLPKRLFTDNKRINIAPILFRKEFQKLDTTETKLDYNQFLLVGRRQLRSNNSWYHNLPNLTKDKLHCYLLINSNDAKRLSFSDFETIAVASDVGQIEVPIQITDEMKEGVVSLPHGWGHVDSKSTLSTSVKNPGASLNDLIDHTRVDFSGTSVLSGIKVKLSKI